MINKLKLRRKAYGYTQEELAYMIGVRRQSITRIENQTYMPTVKLAAKIDFILGGLRSPNFMLSDEEIAELVQRMNDIYVKHFPE